MKRNIIALLLALMMCLALLSACGANDTLDAGEPPASASTPSPAGQGPAGAQPTQKPEQEESKEGKPEGSPEPTQEELKEENNAGTEFLALLQEEYKNGFVDGERPGCTYYTVPSGEEKFVFISNGVVYTWDFEFSKVFSYDIASKNLSEYEIETTVYNYGTPFLFSPIFVMNNTVYGTCGNEIQAYNYNGALQKTVAGQYYAHFDKGIWLFSESDKAWCLYSYDLEKLAEIPGTAQREAAHGLTEDVFINPGNVFTADGTVFAKTWEGYDSEWYRLNTDTYEWESSELTPKHEYSLTDFCGKYVAKEDGIYDRVTGEQVFAYGELYAPAHVGYDDLNLCYFGGDKYLGRRTREGFRWVNLTDLSMSDPLPFPQPDGSYSLYILNDTYCAYKDKFGWFLWNYNDGTEETIVLFDK